MARRPTGGPARTATQLRGDRHQAALGSAGPQTDSTERSVSVIFDAPLDEPVAPLAKAFTGEVTITVDEG